jgi:YVTN family beta-propeller protein
MRSIVASLSLLALACSDGPASLEGDLVVATVEMDGVLAILDGRTGAPRQVVDVSRESHHGTTMFRVHNVQAAPDGRTVWATAMPMLHGDTEPPPEELIGVDVRSPEVIARIPLGTGIMAAHVAIHGATAYVTAYERDVLLVVDLETRQIARTVDLPVGTGPHGLRVSPDGTRIVIAGMFVGSIVVIDEATWGVTSYPLPGRGVQAAMLPDGSAAFVSVYDTRELARLDLATGALALFALPEGSAGPVQLYPTPDGASLWVADQGLVDPGDPTGDRLYRVAVATGAVERMVSVAPGPHGVVVSNDGALVFVTTQVDGTVQTIDAETGGIVATTPVGDMPSGITWLYPGGAMP